MSKLPSGWTAAKVGDVASLNPKNVCSDDLEAGFVPMPLVGTKYRSKIGFVPRAWGQIKKGYTHFADGDVLLAKITPCFENGKAGLVSGMPNSIGAGSTEYFVNRPYSDVVDARYLLALFKTEAFLKAGELQMTGSVGHKRVPKEYLLGTEIPLAPFNEQKRIADKLDAVLARVDACRDRLDRIPVILKRFRQSVLTAAISGQLTEEWRSSNPGIGSGDEQIKSDHAAKALMLKSDSALAKKKSSANADVDSEYIFDIPETWTFTTWGKLTEWITYGFTRPMPSAVSGVKLVTAKDVQYFSLQISEAGHTTTEAFELLSDKDRPCKGDLLITKDGTIGRAALVTTDEPFCINQSVAVCWLRSTSMNKQYLELVANAEFTQRFVFDKAKGMAIQHLSITDFAQAPIPVPPPAEQNEIVRRVESLFAYADRLEARYNTARAQVEKLTPSLLAKAFRGELVPQDPNDEPADELLARNAAAKSEVKPKKRAGRQRKSNPAQ